ncbi:MAG: hypothetical protein ACOX6P_09720 [Candidatus Merdivicinus sp.]|jgi:hypothetical protein
MLKEIGTILLILTAVILFGNIWFHFVDSALERIKQLFIGRKESQTWHPLPPQEKKDPNE